MDDKERFVKFIAEQFGELHKRLDRLEEKLDKHDKVEWHLGHMQATIDIILGHVKELTDINDQKAEVYKKIFKKEEE